jgi:hypothetical protein
VCLLLIKIVSMIVPWELKKSHQTLCKNRQFFAPRKTTAVRMNYCLAFFAPQTRGHGTEIKKLCQTLCENQQFFAPRKTTTARMNYCLDENELLSHVFRADDNRPHGIELLIPHSAAPTPLGPVPVLEDFSAKPPNFARTRMSKPPADNLSVQQNVSSTICYGHLRRTRGHFLSHKFKLQD